MHSLSESNDLAQAPRAERVVLESGRDPRLPAADGSTTTSCSDPYISMLGIPAGHKIRPACGPSRAIVLRDSHGVWDLPDLACIDALLWMALFGISPRPLPMATRDVPEVVSRVFLFRVERPGSGTAGRPGCPGTGVRPAVACSRWFDHDLVLRSMHLHARHARRVKNPTGVQSLPGNRPSRLVRCLGCLRSPMH